MCFNYTVVYYQYRHINIWADNKILIKLYQISNLLNGNYDFTTDK